MRSDKIIAATLTAPVDCKVSTLAVLRDIVAPAFAPPLSLVAAWLIWTVQSLNSVAGAELTPEVLEQRFVQVVRPFLKSYCLDCHGPEKQEAGLSLSDDTSIASVVKNYRVWDNLVDRLEAGEMPPRKAAGQPTAGEVLAVIEWSRALREYEAERNSGDPGTVLARRLSHAEFDHTVHDLTGCDLRPTREFPVDPANEAGFDNSGESLTMSPALVKKYLAAARYVSDHVVLTPNGFVFAPHPVVTETDRDKYCVQQIVSFYQRYEVDYADYFFAAWKFQHRSVLGMPDRTLRDFALEITRPPEVSATGEKLSQQHISDRPDAMSRTPRSRTLSPRYLAAIWSALTEAESVGPLAELQSEWRKIAENPASPSEVRHECERLRDLAITLGKGLNHNVERLHVKGNSDGSQPLVLWWNRQVAGQRMSYHGDGRDLALDAARARYCRVFPNAFSVSSRGHYADPNLGAQLRLLTAGFHLMQGYFRDDQPLYDLVLDEPGRIEIDRLWQDLNFVTSAPLRQYKDFLFFERAEPPQFAGGPEFDFARPEDKEVISAVKLTRMREAYLANARRHDASDPAIEAIETYFANMSTDFRWIEATRITAEPTHLESLAALAERAYRRPLSSVERDELIAFYRRLRLEDGLGHDDAVRDSVASILMSPYFLYRCDLAMPGEVVRPLNDFELASRLSYFLWSSIPDREVLEHAARADLHEPAILMSQARRMLQDDRVRGLATEFAGNWLEFRRFEEHNSVDRERFATFTNELRQAMFEEPLRFFMDIARRNRSVLEFLDGDYTFVNPLLARHYGIKLDPVESSANFVPLDDQWIRVDDVHLQGRGGLLGMSVFLTKNSPGLRTSPVKRGYWVVRRLLGEHIAPPPPDVPELPKDEADSGELSLPQLLARHRDHQACAGCHQRFDSIGLAFEGYGPIGQRRDHDLAGRPIDARAEFPDGSTGSGLEGLRRYLGEHRRNEFVDNLSRKLLSYALGRSLLLSDNATIRRMRDGLIMDGYRFENLIESIITSPQFLNKRGRDDARE